MPGFLSYGEVWRIDTVKYHLFIYLLVETLISLDSKKVVNIFNLLPYTFYTY